MDKKLGVYIHIPFCAGKCPYCDFYSMTAHGSIYDRYTDAVIACINGWFSKLERTVDTVYFGGGTPSLIGAKRIEKILDSFSGVMDRNAEITVECNPSSADSEFFEGIAKAGVNRISVGLQSAVDSERKALGRRAGARDAAKAVENAAMCGISNISLDLMLGIPGQTVKSLRESVDFCAGMNVNHVSAYILKIEKGTPFFLMKDKLNLPDEDEQCELYLSACEALKGCGFEQYEISNFAKLGFESRHNLKYWHCEEYLGIGCAAHSFVDGKRFYYERDINSFMEGCAPVEDGIGGDIDEYIMLALRLTEGLTNKGLKNRFGIPIPEIMLEKARGYQKAGLLICDDAGIRLNAKGFLISNSIISGLLQYI